MSGRVRIHSLRHFFATALITQGENLKYVSDQLGHASIKETADRYGDHLPRERRAAGRFEQRLLSSGRNPADQDLNLVPGS